MSLLSALNLSECILFFLQKYLAAVATQVYGVAFVDLDHPNPNHSMSLLMNTS